MDEYIERGAVNALIEAECSPKVAAFLNHAIDNIPAAEAIEELQKRVPPVPHGDLIDRREAIIDANERAYDFWLSDDEVNATIQFLKEQPTIIPTDPAEEGE